MEYVRVRLLRSTRTLALIEVFPRYVDLDVQCFAHKEIEST